MVAAVCTFGLNATVGSLEPNRYRVRDPKTGRIVIVELTQPLGPAGIFVVTKVSPVEAAPD
jgi:hypothetical protein